MQNQNELIKQGVLDRCFEYFFYNFSPRRTRPKIILTYNSASRHRPRYFYCIWSRFLRWSLIICRVEETIVVAVMFDRIRKTKEYFTQYTDKDFWNEPARQEAIWFSLSMPPPLRFTTHVRALRFNPKIRLPRTESTHHITTGNFKTAWIDPRPTWLFGTSHYPFLIIPPSTLVLNCQFYWLAFWKKIDMLTEGRLSLDVCKISLRSSN